MPSLSRLRSWRRLRALWWRLGRGWGRFDLALARRFGLATPEDRRFFVLIPVVGLLAGIVGVSVQKLIELVQTVLWGTGGSLIGVADSAPTWVFLAAPAAGGLVVGLIILLGRQSVSGGGMSVLIESVALRQGVLPRKSLALSALASIFTVGSGGSVGKEGPMIRFSAMLASTLGERLGVGDHRLKILVGCGAAAGLAAAYNIPVGGAIFAMEIILGNFALEIFGPIVVASVVSTLVARSVVGDVPTYAAAEYTMQSGWELAAYLGLGIVGAVTSLAFVFGVRWARSLFALPAFLPEWSRPVVGLALVGAMGIFVPQVLGGGVDSIEQVLAGGIGIEWLLVLPLAKIVATAVTTGSGGAGGMFTPSLFVGAMVGGAYGTVIHQLFPTSTAAYGAYAAVGMAAIAAGSSHAPISAIIILFEFTGNYDLILPLMIASISATAISRAIYPYSIYEEPLLRKGVDLRWRMEEAVLAGLEVRSMQRPDYSVLRPQDPYSEVVERFLSTRRNHLYVVADDGKLLGHVSLHDIKHVLRESTSLAAVLAHDLMVPITSVLHPETRLTEVAELFSQSDFERLPVVDPGDGTFLGVLAKRDLLAIYSQEVLGRRAILATFVAADSGRSFVELPPDFSLRMIEVPRRLSGVTLAQAKLPQSAGVRVIEITRPTRGGESERILPQADTMLRRGDSLMVIGPTDALERLAAGQLGSEVAGALGDDQAAAHGAID